MKTSWCQERVRDVRVTAVTLITVFLIFLSSCSSPNSPASTYVVSTLTDGNEIPLKFERPEGVAVDADGNLYVTEALGGLWRITPDGTASRIIAGEQLALPAKITVDANGNLFLAESAANRILQITPAGDWQSVAGAGQVGYADGDSPQALFSLPLDVAVNGAGVLYVADSGNGRIRQITPDGQVSTVAGGERGFADGPGSEARFNGIAGLTLDATGTLYVAEANGKRIRLIDPNGTVSTLAGNGEIGFKDGAAAQAQFNGPSDVALDQAGNLYVADLGNHSVRLITPDGQVTTIAGNGEAGNVDGAGNKAQFWFPQAIVVNQNGLIYVADSGNGLIRIIKELEQE